MSVRFRGQCSSAFLPVLFCLIAANGCGGGGGNSELTDRKISQPAFVGDGKYTLTDLGPDNSSSNSINSHGDIVGNITRDSYTSSIFTYIGEQFHSVGTNGGMSASATGINDNGAFTGLVSDAYGFPLAFVEQNGVRTVLPTLGGDRVTASAINNAGQVAGQSRTSDSNVYHAFLYSNGGMTDLGTLGGANSSAYAINDHGQVAGSSVIADTTYGTVSHAFLYSNGGMIDLGTLPGAYAAYGSEADGINDNGDVVGWSVSESGRNEAFLYSGGKMTALGMLSGPYGTSNSYGHSEAADINNNGQIVGETTFKPNDSSEHGFLYQNGTMTDLNTIVRNLGDFEILRASAINDRGQIAAIAVKGSNGHSHAILLTP